MTSRSMFCSATHALMTTTQGAPILDYGGVRHLMADTVVLSDFANAAFRSTRQNLVASAGTCIGCMALASGRDDGVDVLTEG